MTRQRPAPIQETMIAVKFGVVDWVSFACERVSQIAVSHEQTEAGAARSGSAAGSRHHQVPSNSPASK